MKSWVILVAFLILLLTPLWMRLFWEMGRNKTLRMIIVDKTVLNTNSYKHRSINWILDHEKYTHPDGSFYDINKDYFGFFPGENEKYSIRDFDKMSNEELDSVAESNDVVYYADTYGVLGNEWYHHRDINELSESIYGGMSEKDIQLLQKMKELKKLILTEFNSIGFPTPIDVRHNFEKMFGIEWTGWMARYIASLDTVHNPDLPTWFLRAWKKQNARSWPFHGSGILFMHENGDVMVLESGTDLVESIPKIYSEKKIQSRYGVPSLLIYPYWMDIVVNKSDTNEVISKYILATTQAGMEKLAMKKIPKIFPAIIRRTGDYRFFYFCGDFADNPTKFRFAKLYGITGLKFLMYNAVDETDRNRFFWEFYLPLMQNILGDYYETLRKGH
ncbi:MAG: hypothetical protein IT242_03660 [Bacteroidia bacterium]|nr:hypothetical protein [Bacteroidia bacterium]